MPSTVSGGAGIAAEMEKLGYDKVEFDKLGNVIGWIGSGDKIIAIVLVYSAISSSCVL